MGKCWLATRSVIALAWRIKIVGSIVGTSSPLGQEAIYNQMVGYSRWMPREDSNLD